jgi:hypothetical protein
MAHPELVEAVDCAEKARRKDAGRRLDASRLGRPLIQPDIRMPDGSGLFQIVDRPAYGLDKVLQEMPQRYLWERFGGGLARVRNSEEPGAPAFASARPGTGVRMSAGGLDSHVKMQRGGAPTSAAISARTAGLHAGDMGIQTADRTKQRAVSTLPASRVQITSSDPLSGARTQDRHSGVERATFGLPALGTARVPWAYDGNVPIASDHPTTQRTAFRPEKTVAYANVAPERKEWRVQPEFATEDRRIGAEWLSRVAVQHGPVHPVPRVRALVQRGR